MPWLSDDALIRWEEKSDTTAQGEVVVERSAISRGVTQLHIAMVRSVSLRKKIIGLFSIISMI